MEQIKFDLTDYLRLDNEKLYNLRGNASRCIFAELPESKLFLVTMLAPTDYCWGMEFAFSRTCKKYDQEILQTVDPDSVADEVSSTGLILGEVMAGMIPLVINPDTSDFEYGNDEEALFSWWFRCYALPVRDGIIEDFLDIWTRHETQLGKYFLFPYADQKVQNQGAGQCFLPWKDADTLNRLFCSKTGPLGVEPFVLIDLLEEYEDADEARELEDLLTPEFLLQECVRWSIDLLPQPPGFSSDIVKLMTASLGNDVSKIADIRTRTATLRIRIARNLQWPLGVRYLSEILDLVTDEIRASSVLCAETQAYLDAAVLKFPVLRE
ncbi:hypothetical protein [Undibacterium sp. Tian12W]|uniref:hypothetical protein n=1 Tax=Undibacterium sp. Tian12W TaxID=3413054 RepID=UPI003BF15D44